MHVCFAGDPLRICRVLCALEMVNVARDEPDVGRAYLVYDVQDRLYAARKIGLKSLQLYFAA
jgi:hypothetical protein